MAMTKGYLENMSKMCGLDTSEVEAKWAAWKVAFNHDWGNSELAVKLEEANFRLWIDRLAREMTRKVNGK